MNCNEASELLAAAVLGDLTRDEQRAVHAHHQLGAGHYGDAECERPQPDGHLIAHSPRCIQAFGYGEDRSERVGRGSVDDADGPLESKPRGCSHRAGVQGIELEVECGTGADSNVGANLAEMDEGEALGAAKRRAGAEDRADGIRGERGDRCQRADGDRVRRHRGSHSRRSGESGPPRRGSSRHGARGARPR